MTVREELPPARTALPGMIEIAEGVIVPDSLLIMGDQLIEAQVKAKEEDYKRLTAAATESPSGSTVRVVCSEGDRRASKLSPETAL